MTKQRVAIIQTSSVSTLHLGSLFKELLLEVVANGSPTNAVIRRTTAHAQAA